MLNLLEIKKKILKKTANLMNLKKTKNRKV